MKGFRLNVAAILQRADGQILIGERVGMAEAWQFPQGGLMHGEEPVEALHRELREEIGLAPAAYEIVASRAGYRYEFPAEVQLHKEWAGQEQTYFLCRYLGEGRASEFQLQGEEQEFSRVRWIEPRDFCLAWLPEFKRGVYRQVFWDLLGLRLE